MADEDTKKVEFTAEQQALVDKLVGDARVKARTKADADAAAKLAKDKEAAEQAGLAAEKKWKELADKHAARVAELEPLEATAKAFDDLVAGMLKDRVKALGDAAAKFAKALPESMSALDKLNLLNQNEELFQAASGDGVGTPKRSAAKKPEGDKKTGSASRFPIRL